MKNKNVWQRRAGCWEGNSIKVITRAHLAIHNKILFFSNGNKLWGCTCYTSLTLALHAQLVICVYWTYSRFASHKFLTLTFSGDTIFLVGFRAFLQGKVERKGNIVLVKSENAGENSMWMVWPIELTAHLDKCCSIFKKKLVFISVPV